MHPSRRLARPWRSGVSLLLYLAATCVLFHMIVLHPGSRAPLAGRSDPGQMMWYLESTAQSIVHGHSPFITHAMYAPHGTNLMWSAAMPLAGAVLAPVTLVLGPVIAFNVLFVLGPALTAWTAWLWLARHVRHPAAAWLGGALVGFGPFETAHLAGHANLVVLPLVPLALYLLEDLLWRVPNRRLRRGALLGIVIAGQALLSEEVVILLALGVVVAMLVAFAVRPRLTGRTVRAAIPGGLLAVGVVAALLAWPVGTQLFGPLRAPGVAYPAIVSQPRDLVSPTSRFLLHPFVNDPSLHVGRRSSPAETGGYLGVPLLALLALGLVALRRQWPAWVAVVTAAACFSMSMGAGAAAGGHADWRIPFGPVFHLPVMRSVVAQRFALPMDLAVALLAAMTLDHFLAARRGRATALTIAAVALVALSLLPASPSGPKEVQVPAFFTTSAVRRVPNGAVVLVLPAPTNTNDAAAMLWAAKARLRFHMVGGYGYVREGGVLSGHSFPDPISVIGDRLGAGGAPPAAAEAEAARAALRWRGVGNVLVVVEEDPGHGYERAATSVFGPPQPAQGGVLLWAL